MTTPPAFQFYPRDYVMSTRVMTPEQRGVYMDLLCFAWDGNGLPDELRDMAAMVGLSPAKFTRIWGVIGTKFEQGEDGRWRNPRQERQRNEMDELREKRRRAGQASAEARANG